MEVFVFKPQQSRSNTKKNINFNITLDSWVHLCHHCQKSNIWVTFLFCKVTWQTLSKIRCIKSLYHLFNQWYNPAYLVVFWGVSHIKSHTHAHWGEMGGKVEIVEKHQQSLRQTEGREREKETKRQLHICQNLIHGTSPSCLAWPSLKVQAVRFFPV